MKHSYALLFLVVSFSGCATGPEWIRNDPFDYQTSRVFNSGFETTWSAVIRALEAHPITTIEKASGILLTDWVQGNSPLYLRKYSVPFSQRETKRAIGVYFAQLTPNLVYIAHAMENAPAFKAGVRSLDIVFDVNGQRIRNSNDFSRIVGSAQQLIIRILRYGQNEPLNFTIVPQEITFSTTYQPVTTRYKLNVRASRISDTQTEVKIINYEEGDFGYADRYGWHSNYQAIPNQLSTTKG